MALEAVLKDHAFERVVLEEYEEGVYVFMFEHKDKRIPDRDYLQDSMELAIEFCEEEFRIPREVWKEIPDPGLR